VGEILRETALRRVGQAFVWLARTEPLTKALERRVAERKISP